MKNKKILLIFSSVFAIIVLSYTSLAAYIGFNAEKDSKTKSDAILVLGARSYIEGKYNPCLEARVSHAAGLYKNGFAKKILVSGGNDREDNVNEAETMKKMLVEKGVTAKDILEEKEATSTFENFKYSQAILKKYNLQSVIVVTEPFHAARASLVAKKLQFNYTLSSAKDSPCWQPNKYVSKYFLKEPFAIGAYKVQGKL